MSLIGMPVLILNLGSEMVYILDQVTNFRRNLLSHFPVVAGGLTAHVPEAARPEHPQREELQRSAANTT